VVVGGGIAGLAAATGLAERGVAVTLLEAADELGGRVRAWPVEVAGTPTTMSRGFHAFFRQYYNLRALLRRTDPGLERLTPIEDYPLRLADGPQDSFAGIPKTPPWGVAAFVLASPSFRLRDLRHVDIDAAMGLLDVDFPATLSAYDGVSAAEFLDRLNFPETARHLALEVFARSFFADPRDFSAGELVAMFHSYFMGSAEGLLFDVPTDDYDAALWAPLGSYLAGLGVDVRTGTPALALAASESGLSVTVAGQELVADAVVLATDLRTTRALVRRAETLGTPAWREGIAVTRDAPPFGVLRLWLDRPVDADRLAFLGTSGFGPLDNVTVLERFEAGAARWAAQHGGSVVELHAYAMAAEPDVVRAQLLVQLARIYPETTAAQIVAEQWLVRDDCPLVGTEPWASRPEVGTPDPRLVLAGDGVRCDFPVALMERAATTGFLAANQLLAGWGRPGHELWTVPMTARIPGVHRLRRSA
jgi:isorenieratene synthase